ncbi:MAG: ELM1/GtrOC1 family putative glycosyltransferase [Alphaproteobacteria bacterium]
MNDNTTIWVLTETGDMSGRRNALDGVARHLSEDIHHLSIYDLEVPAIPPENIDAPTMQTDFNDTQHDIGRHEMPDIILTDLNNFNNGNGQSIESYDNDIEVSFPDTVFVSADMQFLNWENFAQGSDRNLSPHNLTHEQIKNEAHQLQSRLGESSPIIAIMVSEISPRENLEDLQEKLTQITQSHPESDIYLCSAPRTDPDIFNALYQTVQNTDNTVHVYDWKNEQGENNPYIGLLQLAEHMVIVGESHSTLSERLFTGQSAYTYYEHPKEVEDYIRANSNQTNQGQIKDLKTEDISNGLTTDKFPPIDITPAVAQGIQNQYEQHLQKQRSLGNDLLEDTEPPI